MPEPLLISARFSRWLQSMRPDRPIRGISRYTQFMRRYLPPVQSTVSMSDQFKMMLDSRVEAEGGLLFTGSYQIALAHLLRQYLKPGHYCVDIGANLGFYTLMFAALSGTGGRVVAFEANPALTQKLATQCQINNFDTVDIVQKAVHHRTGETAQFYISNSPGKSSLYAEHAGYIVETHTVTTITLDDYLSTANWQRLDLIKIDIEGNDCLALMGGKDMLMRFRPMIVFEFWQSTPAQQIDAIRSLFKQLDYRLEYLLLNGQRDLFEWKTPGGLHHVDVICIPPGKAL